MDNKINAVINFVFFLANFPGSFNEIISKIWANNPGLAQHFISKINGLNPDNSGSITPGTIIRFFFELSNHNQIIFLEWIEKNYHYSSKHLTQWEISIPVPVQEVKDILITALEGGSNYWYYLPDVEMAQKEEYKSLPLSVKIINAVIDHGEVVPVYDVEDENEKLGEISRENIERGLKLYIPGNILDGSADAGEADRLFQLIVMGEVVYG